MKKNLLNFETEVVRGRYDSLLNEFEFIPNKGMKIKCLSPENYVLGQISHDIDEEAYLNELVERLISGKIPAIFHEMNSSYSETAVEHLLQKGVRVSVYPNEIADKITLVAINKDYLFTDTEYSLFVEGLKRIDEWSNIKLFSDDFIKILTYFEAYRLDVLLTCEPNVKAIVNMGNEFMLILNNLLHGYPLTIIHANLISQVMEQCPDTVVAFRVNKIIELKEDLELMLLNVYDVTTEDLEVDEKSKEILRTLTELEINTLINLNCLEYNCSYNSRVAGVQFVSYTEVESLIFSYVNPIEVINKIYSLSNAGRAYMKLFLQ